MKLFGINISFGSRSEDRVTVETVKPSTTPVSKIPPVKIGSLSYAQQFASGRAAFLSAEYDLSEVGVAEDTESFLAQSFRKKEGLMFKEGVGFKGPNKDTIRYIKTRMAQMSRASNIPEIDLIKRTARSLIRVSNAFLIKVRKPEASGGRIRTTADGKTLKPVAAYFPAAPETMRADLDQDTGKIRKWRQILPDGRYRDHAPENVVHFSINRREGFLFGVPTAVPVLDDIRALRQIEENIELLIYQHLFPLFHYKVGTETAPAGYTEEGTKEVDAVRDQIRLMPSEGALVTSERHEIKAVGAEGRAIHAEKYLEHFKKRVFSGLGMSSVDLGEADTSNRSTAFSMSRALVDSVKAIQDDFEAQWDHFIISELLLESTFGERVLEEDEMVHLYFAEIDIRNKMELEQHATELWKANGLTYDEYRAQLGYEPIPIPDDPEDQDMSKYPEWSKTYWKLIEEPTNLIRAVDEAFSPQAQAAAASRSLGITTKNLQTSQQAKDKQQQNQNEIKQPTNITKQDNFLTSSFKELETETAFRLKNSIESRGNIDSLYLLSVARTWADNIAEKFQSVAVSEFIRGFNNQTGNLSANAETLISLGRSTLRDRIYYRMTKLVENTFSLMMERFDQTLGDVKLIEAKEDAINELHTAFDSVRYRTSFIWDVEVRKAYNFGLIMGMKFVGQYGVKLNAHPDGCDKCQALDGKIIQAEFATIEDIPPLHPNSRMTLEKVDNE